MASVPEFTVSEPKDPVTKVLKQHSIISTKKTVSLPAVNGESSQSEQATHPRSKSESQAFLLRTAPCEYEDDKENLSPSKFPTHKTGKLKRASSLYGATQCKKESHKRSLSARTLFADAHTHSKTESSLEITGLFTALTVSESVQEVPLGHASDGIPKPEPDPEPADISLTAESTTDKSLPSSGSSPLAKRARTATRLHRADTEPNLFGSTRSLSLHPPVFSMSGISGEGSSQPTSPNSVPPKVFEKFSASPTLSSPSFTSHSPVHIQVSTKSSSPKHSYSPMPTGSPSGELSQVTTRKDFHLKLKATVSPANTKGSSSPSSVPTPPYNAKTRSRNTPPLVRQQGLRNLPSVPLVRSETEPPGRLKQLTVHSAPSFKPDETIEKVPVQLPTLQNTSHPDLNCLSAETVAGLVQGNYNELFANIIVIDCRFPYEYEGGHIKSAVNFPCDDLFEPFFLRDSTYQQCGKKLCIVFHCEFSSHRAPKAYKKLRSLDRKLHEHCYPVLFYPEMYLLEGGFKKFWESFPDLCEPRGYVEMKDSRFVKEMRIAMRSSSKVKRRYFSRSCTDVFAARTDSDDEDGEEKPQGLVEKQESDALRRSSRL